MTVVPLPDRLDALAGPPDAPEASLLWHARRAGVPVAPIAVVPPGVEFEHYRLNNLPARLDALFAGVDRSDPDEDDLEELAPAAEALVRGAALLDEVIERFYGALEGVPDRVTVRRDGAAGPAVVGRREALLAVKRSWSEAWTVRAILLRARAGAWAPEAGWLLVHGAELRPAPVDLGDGGTWRGWLDPGDRVARVELARPASDPA